MFRYRVALMRAFRDKDPSIVLAIDPPEHPYFAASAALARGEREGMIWETDTPGLLMLIPQLRRRGRLR